MGLLYKRTKNNASPRHHQLSNKKPSECSGYVFIGQWVVWPLKHYRVLPSLLVTLQNLIVSSYCWRPVYLNYRTWRSQAGTHLEGSMHATREEKPLLCFPRSVAVRWISYATIMTSLSKYSYCFNSGRSVMGAANFFLVGFKPAL